MKKKLIVFISVLCLYQMANANTIHSTDSVIVRSGSIQPDADNAGLILPKGFAALIVTSAYGKPRHIAVTPEGYLYVKLAQPFNGNGIYLLKDKNGDGKIDDAIGFGNYGGTGNALKDGYLYASSDENVYRYKLNNQHEVTNLNDPDEIIHGLLNRREHESKSITLENNGNIYVNIGAYSNAWQVQDRVPGSPGMKPCPILDSAGGIWQFKDNQMHQTYGDGVRYATCLRNVVGLDWNTQTNSLFVMQHGRDQLHDNWPRLFTVQQSAELPAECMYEIHKGDNAGWPYIYYDQIQHKKILAPEYGGNGKKTAGEDAINPIMAFPGHLAPDGLLFYTGNMFPEKYKHGAFIAFHGSWNRAPLPQEGYYVVFAPFKDGKPTGEWEVFANGFAGKPPITSARNAHRRCGLAQGPYGSLYVTDDNKGAIYRIIYTGK
jgi:glucose/arabinose dehydrogenase